MDRFTLPADRSCWLQARQCAAFRRSATCLCAGERASLSAMSCRCLGRKGRPSRGALRSGGGAGRPWAVCSPDTDKGRRWVVGRSARPLDGPDYKRAAPDRQRLQNDIYSGIRGDLGRTATYGASPKILPNRSTLLWISSLDVVRPREIRMLLVARSTSRPRASRTCDGSSDPLAQADPAETSTPARSSRTTRVRASPP